MPCLLTAFPASQAVVITVSGMLIVFSVLVLLVIIIKLFGVVLGGSKKPKKKDTVKVEEKKSEMPGKNTDLAFDGIDDETVAVISAAVYAFESGTNCSIRSIKPAKTDRQRPEWAKAGILQNVRPF